jgi:hypothetical protein
MGIKELSDKGPDGTRLGQSATDLVAFYGTGPVVQPSVTAAVTSTEPVLGATAAYGFSTSAQFNSLISKVNSVIAALKTLGLMATA